MARFIKIKRQLLFFFTLLWSILTLSVLEEDSAGTCPVMSKLCFTTRLHLSHRPVHKSQGAGVSGQTTLTSTKLANRRVLLDESPWKH